MYNIIKNTKEIETSILKSIESSIYYDQLKISLDSIFYFTNKFYFPGTYVYSDGTKYHHISIGDRGKKSRDNVTYDIDDLKFRILEILVFNVALKMVNKSAREDYRRQLFRFELEILSSISVVYEERLQEKISYILEMFPYDDSLQ